MISLKNNNEIKISVIIPIFNTAKYLEKCLKSILEQDLKEIEVILVNDGSPDESYKIIDKYAIKDKRIKVINKKNEGLSSARNAGIEISVGKYVIHLDSDDWVEEGYLKEAYEFAEKNNLDVVIMDYLREYSNGKIEYIKQEIKDNYTDLEPKSIIESIFSGKIHPSACNKMFKLSLYKENGIRHPKDVSLGEDLGTTPLLIKYSNRIGKLDKAYLHYICNYQSITKTNQIKKIYELNKVYEVLSINLNNFIEKVYLDTLYIDHIGGVFFTSDFKNYELEVEIFLKTLKKIKKIKSIRVRNKIFFKILKKYPNKEMLKLLNLINRVGKKITNK